jgi:Bacterial archaeo-eukaryotic release factor family 3
MDLLTKNDLSILLKTSGVCASIYAPIHRGPEALQDPIRLKHLLESAERQMLANGLSIPQAKNSLGPVRDLIEGFAFGGFRADGLAIFACGDSFRCFHLPIRFPDAVVVSRRFHIKPLLPLLSGDGQFYVLAISENRVRLFQGSRYSITELKREDLPDSLADAQGSESFERQRQMHTAGASGKRVAVYHGHVAAIEDPRQTRLRYFRQIDAGLRSLAHHNRAPLVLAGVEELFPLYREANTHPVLLECGIAGNPDRSTADELYAAAWEIVEPYFAREKTTSLNRYRDWAGTSRASNELGEILSAVNRGRVDHLFVKSDVELWGIFDADHEDVSLHVNREPGDDDLLNLAGAQAILHGATVYALPSGEMPEGHDIAALFRY